MPYLTPESNPADYICRIVFIPNGLDWLALVTGALEELTFVGNFEQYGAQTPGHTAERFTTMFDGFCFARGGCRVIGEIVTFAGVESPDPKWLVCDGSSLLRTDYPDLFNVIGTVYGADDSDHFNIPDLQGRSPAGAGAGAGLSAVAVGEEYGEENHVLSVGELAAHSHTDSGHSHAEGIAIPTIINGGLEAPAASAYPGTGATGIGYASIGNTGDSDGHNTIGPRLGVLMLIVARD